MMIFSKNITESYFFLSNFRNFPTLWTIHLENIVKQVQQHNYLLLELFSIQTGQRTNKIIAPKLSKIVEHYEYMGVIRMCYEVFYPLFLLGLSMVTESSYNTCN